MTLIGGCGTRDALLKSENSLKKSILSDTQRKKRALDHFVNGTVYEAQNNYQDAVKEFEKALNYDTTAGIY